MNKICKECEYELEEAEVKNANDLPKLGETWTDGRDYICADCYRTGYDDWISESMQPCDSYEMF